MIGTENVVDMAERLGLQWDPRQEDNVAVPSLTLGTIGVHQIDLAAAYGALANGGVRAETYMIEKITDRDGNVIYDHAQDAAEPPAHPVGAGRLPGHRHPGRQHRSRPELDLGRALPAPDR